MTEEEKNAQQRWDLFAAAAISGLASRGTYDTLWIVKEAKKIADEITKP